MTTPKTTFADLGLCTEILDALSAVGYTHPTPIQEQAIPIVLMGRDVVGVAQTGTGKTASFTLPLIEILKNGRPKARMPRALILAPTRELAAQIQENFVAYGKKTSLTSALIVGGDSMKDQNSLLQRGVDILIATPGRLLDHFQRGSLLLTDVKIFVIDEADRMLDMGFIPDIEKIAKMLPKMRQTLMFTATMQPVILKLTEQFLQNPKQISVARASSTAQTITQEIYHTTAKQKYQHLVDILKKLKPTSALIFCNRKTEVDKLRRYLHDKNFKAEAMHGDMAQAKRYESLDRFKKGESNIFICSDIAARGIDIDDVSHVFNFDVPRNAEDYVHRIGRTGRAGKTGHTIMFVTDEDAKNLEAIEKLTQQKLPQMKDLVEAKSVSEAASPKLESDKPAQKHVPAPRPPKHAKEPTKEQVREEKPKAPAPLKKEPIRHDPSVAPRDISQEDDNTNDKSVGFGEDVPAFMRPFQ